MTYNRKSVKQKAKLAMSQAKPKVWVVTLVMMLLMAGVSLLTQLIPNGDFMETMMEVQLHPERIERLVPQLLSTLALFLVLSVVVGVVVALFEIVIEYGYYGYALKVYRGEKAGLGNLFDGFKRLGTVLGSGIMVVIFEFLWFLLLWVASLVAGLLLGLLSGYFSVPTPVIVLALVALVVLDVVWGLWIACRYVLTPYFVMSRPDMGVFEAITASKTAMKGNKIRYIVLELSFLGWELLVGLIAFAVSALGTVLALLFASDTLFLITELAERGASPERILDAIGGLLVPFAVVFIVAVLVALPLELWLTGYRTVSCAGFFHAVTGDLPAAGAPVVEAPVAQAVAAPAAPVSETVTPPAAPVVESAAQPPVAAPGSGETPYDPFGGAQAPAPQPPQQEEE